MAQGSANITSIDAMRRFKPALLAFVDEVTNALMLLDLEGRRPLDWMEQDRVRYWPRELQKASDAVSESRVALQRAKMALSEEDQKYCYDERKALEQAKNRLHLCEAKVAALKRWRPKIRKAVEEFQVEIAKLRQYMDNDFHRAIASLTRMLDALDKYTIALPAAGSSGGEPVASARTEGDAS